jgi:hypothetical protein
LAWLAEPSVLILAMTSTCDSSVRFSAISFMLRVLCCVCYIYMLPYDALHVQDRFFISSECAVWITETQMPSHLFSCSQSMHTVSSYYVIAFCASIGSNVSTDLLSCQNCLTQSVSSEQTAN